MSGASGQVGMRALGAASVVVMGWLPACGSDGAEADGTGGTSSSGGSASGGSGGGTASGGTASGGSASGGSGASDGTGGAPQGTARPQLSDAAAADHTMLAYLARRGSVTNPTVDDWDPTAGLGDVGDFTADFTVAESGGTHTSVQAAIDAAIDQGGTERVFIEVTAGTYREVVCVASSTPPITLYGSGSDPSETVIVFDNYAGKPKATDESANPCASGIGNTTYGTSGSATFAAYANGFQAKNLTFENDTDESAVSDGLQAVALMTQGDQIVLDSVRLLGNQDTFYVKSVNPAIAVRVYVTNSHIQGDTDFVFGNAVLVIDQSTLHFVSTNKTSGAQLAPSTHALNPYGFLVVDSTFSADAGAPAAQVHLGRAWDESQGTLDAYLQNVQTGDYPNGAALVRDSTLGPHIAPAPWTAAATTARPFSSVEHDGIPANRLYEYNNSGEGSGD